MAKSGEAERETTPIPDVLVIGAGAFGLWTALACLTRGLSVAVADRGPIGEGAEGASSTPTGALAPHMPDPWTDLKAFQARALDRLPAALEALEAETGLCVGHARPGRLQPLADEEAVARARPKLAAMQARLTTPCALLRPGDWDAAWLEAPAALMDGETARLDPPRLIAALAAACRARGARMMPGRRLLGLAPGTARFHDGAARAGRIALAAGAATFELAGIPGGAEHGMALRLAPRRPPPPRAPLIGGPGLWVVPHADGTIGLGATTTRGDCDPQGEAALARLLARAEALCPALRGAETIRRWQGLRPRADNRLPLIGPLPDRPQIIAVGGGQRIGLALAREAGEIAADLIVGEETPGKRHGGTCAGLPDSFRPEAHLASARAAAARRG